MVVHFLIYLHHRSELFLSDLAIRMLDQEMLVLSVNLLSADSGVIRNEIEVLFSESGLAIYAAHFGKQREGLDL